MIGTSGAMRVAYEGDPPPVLPSELWCYRVDRRRVVVGGALSDGGSLYRWMRQTLALSQDEDEIERTLAAMKPDTHGLVILPSWAGERSTGWSATARGAILGLTSDTKPIDILRSAMESIAYRFALIAETLNSVAPAGIGFRRRERTTCFALLDSDCCRCAWSKHHACYCARGVMSGRGSPGPGSCRQNR